MRQATSRSSQRLPPVFEPVHLIRGGLTFVRVFKLLSILATAHVVWARVLIIMHLVIVIASLVRLQAFISVLRRLAEWTRILLKALERSVAIVAVMVLNGTKWVHLLLHVVLLFMHVTWRHERLRYPEWRHRSVLVLMLLLLLVRWDL